MLGVELKHLGRYRGAAGWDGWPVKGARCNDYVDRFGRADLSFDKKALGPALLAD
jgi:hypothetical protein